MRRRGATWRSTATSPAATTHTLFSILDRCRTPMGSRLLRRWLHRPLRDTQTLEARLDAVADLLAHYRFETLRDLLAPSVTRSAS
jgi:DNA mismatch repair protein MutS